ncbi:MAG: hypothetical protein K1060chlam4_00428, partial [Candidatus Anoxychlamydiales bacterium]|nr:hypothetical protein [Candidatus Anoxychlamydiales bacterium]
EIFDFFELDDEARVEKFEEILSQIARFSEKIQDRILNGTEEDNKDLQDFLKDMQEKVENEKAKVFEKVGVSEEQFKEFLNDKSNFSEEDWASMQEMKGYLKETIMPNVPKINKIKRKKSRTKWIQS